MYHCKAYGYGYFFLTVMHGMISTMGRKETDSCYAVHLQPTGNLHPNSMCVRPVCVKNTCVCVDKDYPVPIVWDDTMYYCTVIWIRVLSHSGAWYHQHSREGKRQTAAKLLSVFGNLYPDCMCVTCMTRRQYKFG